MRCSIFLLTDDGLAMACITAAPLLHRLNLVMCFASRPTSPARSWYAERDNASLELPASPVSSTWSTSDSDSDEEADGESAALVLRRHGSSPAAVARALVRVRFLQEERQSLQHRLQARLLKHPAFPS